MKGVLEDLYKNNAKNLYLMVDKILASIGGSYYNDKDEFYAEASEVLADIVVNHRYDGNKGNFKGYLYGALRNAILDIIKKQNTLKRKADKLAISLESPVSQEGSMTIGDSLCSDFDIIKELEEMGGVLWEENIEKYLKGLTKIQRDILALKMQEMTSEQIKSCLHISNKQYEQNMHEIKSFEHVSVLHDPSKSKLNLEKECKKSMCIQQTLEKSKPDKMSIHSIVKKMDKRTIRFDHPLQRSSDQWSPVMKGNLISDILQGNPLPELVFAEQVVNGIAIIWDLDGKQRCTNAYAFIKDHYRISRNIRRWMIEYQSQVVDENKQIVVDENNFPVYERKEFDIRGKKFSDLPEELQEKFQDYNFEITQYLNCDSDDIAYHIARYNEGKPATVSQKGLIRLGEEFAVAVKSISNMQFFKDIGGYKVSEFKNGTINRVVVESIMASYYILDWKKKQEDMCDYIKKNASMSDFEQFEDNVHRLEKVMIDEVSDMFDSRDSFLWFGLFSRFIQICNEDHLFISFLKELKQSLHTKKVEGVSFDELNVKSTKDKVVIQTKMKHLETLLREYLGTKQQKTDMTIDISNMQWEKYVQSFVNADLTYSLQISDEEKKILALRTVMFMNSQSVLNTESINEYIIQHSITNEEMENILLYMDMLNSWSLELKGGFAITPYSIPSLIRVTQYALTKDIEDPIMIELLNQWAKHFPKSYNTEQMYDLYLHMKNDLDSAKKEVV